MGRWKASSDGPGRVCLLCVSTEDQCSKARIIAPLPRISRKNLALLVLVWEHKPSPAVRTMAKSTAASFRTTG